MVEPPDTTVGVAVEGDTVGEYAEEPEPLSDPLVEPLPFDEADPLGEPVAALEPEEEVLPEAVEDALPGSS